MKLIIRAVCALALLLPLAAQALTQDITAVFRPDPSNPLLNRFVNTTPESGICPWHIPERCKALGIFSIRTSDLTFSSSVPIQGGHTDVRKGAMFKVPSEWRDVIVSHAVTGASETVRMRIAGIGGRFDLYGGVGQTVWARGAIGWKYAPAPCLGTNYGTGNNTFFLWSWITPLNVGACDMAAIKDIPDIRYPVFEYSYELSTPNPLTMDSGVYTGSITYSVGPRADFDFGDIMEPNDNQLTFNFILDVDHHLKVEVPPGGNRVQLEPQEGWQAWLKNGRKPTRLFRDQTVNLWASSPFKMTLECGEPMGNTCSMRNAAGDQVPLDVAVTLPVGLNDSVGRPVNRLPLRLDGVGTQLFQPTRYIDRKPSTLHFEIKADSVSQMLDHGGGSAYSGTATVVWDSGL
ncbi:hypothetical protein [Pseudomonas palleroniana]|uniref:Fimbrial protein n=1 Tax=Pseudomonas palleroniana TaxID=191390 RepID=A0A0X7K4T7_9PSED|nr:hypothetical protein [Pseudomonas palleroniana]KWU50697.1 hypothetical protein AWV77_11920 [Pseudomonas palleroniana]